MKNNSNWMEGKEVNTNLRNTTEAFCEIHADCEVFYCAECKATFSISDDMRKTEEGDFILSCAECGTKMISEGHEEACGARAEWIEKHLTDEDVAAWHDGRMTDNVEMMMRIVRANELQIWGSRNGSESLSVVVK